MIESLLLVSSLCIDSFVASIAYGTSKIKIPIKFSFYSYRIFSHSLGKINPTKNSKQIYLIFKILS